MLVLRVGLTTCFNDCITTHLSLFQEVLMMCVTVKVPPVSILLDSIQTTEIHRLIKGLELGRCSLFILYKNHVHVAIPLSSTCYS